MVACGVVEMVLAGVCERVSGAGRGGVVELGVDASPWWWWWRGLCA